MMDYGARVHVGGKRSRIQGATFYNAAEFAIDEVEACRAAMLQGADTAADNTNQQFESLSRGDK